MNRKVTAVCVLFNMFLIAINIWAALTLRSRFAWANWVAAGFIAALTAAAVLGRYKAAMWIVAFLIAFALILVGVTLASAQTEQPPTCPEGMVTATPAVWTPPVNQAEHQHGWY